MRKSTFVFQVLVYKDIPMKRAAKYLAAAACAGAILSALPALALASGNGGSVSAIGSSNNGGAKAGNGGSGSSGGNGGNVIASGSENNGGAAAGDGGSGGSVQSVSLAARILDLNSSLRARLSR
jgi:hypothetical protein